MRFNFFAIAAAILLAACNAQPRLSGPLTLVTAPSALAPEFDVVVEEAYFPPNTTVPRHHHPGEEYIYLIEGSVPHREEGKPDRVYKAGEAIVIPAGVIHSPRTEKEPSRAIIFRLHPRGKPMRLAAPKS